MFKGVVKKKAMIVAQYATRMGRSGARLCGWGAVHVLLRFIRLLDKVSV